MRKLLGSILAAATAALAALVGTSLAGPNQITAPATAGVPAQRLKLATVPGDYVSVYQSSMVSPEVILRAQIAATAAGGIGTPRTGFSIGMTQVRRGAQVIQAAPPGMRIPMGVTALPQEVAGWVMSPAVGAALAQPGTVVMGRTSADLRGARAGDTIDLVAASGVPVTFTIGLVAPDPEVGGAEIVMTTANARLLGADVVTSVLLWGFHSRDAVDAALAAQGLTGRTDVRVVRSWDPRNPDSGIGLAETKALFGEFAYRVNSDGSITQDRAWFDANIYCPPGSAPGCYVTLPFTSPLQPGVRPTVRCHKVTMPALLGALAEITAAGLANRIDVRNWNSYGGCHFVRFNRLSTVLPAYTAIGWLSRHSWGQAVDINTCMLDRPIPYRTCSGSNVYLRGPRWNCQGCEPGLDCQVVRIFRRWGFAWGGNYLTPDGMHIEYVGERRDTWPYPSRYCPNEAPQRFGRMAAGPTEGEVMFAYDGLSG